MRNKESIKELLEYLQTTANKPLQFNDDAIVAAYEEKNTTQSLAIKVLSIFGGFLASLAFIGFLFIAGLYNSEEALLIFGTVFIAAAICINKLYDKIIIDTISVSLFIIGFVLLGFGLSVFQMGDTGVCMVFIIISLISLLITQNYILSFVSVLIINGSVLALIISLNQYDLIHLYVSILAVAITYVFLKEAKMISINNSITRLYSPVRIGLIFSYLSGLTMLGKKGIVPVSAEYIWLSSILNILAIIYLLSYLFDILLITRQKQKIAVYLIAVLLLLPTALSPAISGAILVMLLSFLVNYKTGFVIGIIAFIYFISQYYYDLNYTLLTKSLLMLSSGILFICLYFFTHKKLTTGEKI